MAKSENVELYRQEFAAVLPGVEHWHKMAVQHSKMAIWAAAMCGAELRRLKGEIGHGGWMKFLKALPFSDDTAHRYMDLAAEWESRVGQIPHACGISSDKRAKMLGSGSVIDISAEEVAEISEATTELIGEKTLRQLYFDWGICKAPYHPGGNMRGDKPRPPAPTPDEIRQTWADEWVRVVGDVYDQACRKKTWCHLTDGELAEHTQSIIRVLEELENEADRRKRTGKGRG